jgi:hypothetical protein
MEAEDSHIHTRRHEDLKSHILLLACVVAYWNLKWSMCAYFTRRHLKAHGDSVDEDLLCSVSS